MPSPMSGSASLQARGRADRAGDHRQARRTRRRERARRRRSAQGCRAGGRLGSGSLAAIQLPTKPIAPAAARRSERVDAGAGRSGGRWPRSRPRTRWRRSSTTTASPAQRSAVALRSANATPSGMAVTASPQLWTRSASSATLPEATNSTTWAVRGEGQHAAALAGPARTPSRERLIDVDRPGACELRPLRPWRCGERASFRRRGRDSNPRAPCGAGCFQGSCNRPDSATPPSRLHGSGIVRRTSIVPLRPVRLIAPSAPSEPPRAREDPP